MRAAAGENGFPLGSKTTQRNSFLEIGPSSMRLSGGCGHYVFEEAIFKQREQELFENIKAHKPEVDPERFILDRIKQSIDRYVRAFALEGGITGKVLAEVEKLERSDQVMRLSVAFAGLPNQVLTVNWPRLIFGPVRALCRHY